MTNKTLLKAILSMDSYSRGYGVKIPDLESSEGTKIGNAIIGIQSETKENEPSVKASFYAISYSYNGETIISYRGTDVISIDSSTGWTTGAGSYSSPQAKLAVEFYKSVIGDANPYDANVEFVGHSLGGGLAGMMASLYSKEATIFDNMPFEAAASGAYEASTLDLSIKEDVVDEATKALYYFNGSSPQAPSNSSITAYATTGEILASLRGVQSTDVTYLDSNGGLRDPLDLHSQALLVTLLYAKDVVGNSDWENIGKELMDALFDDSVGSASGSDNADQMFTKIAYSAIYATGDDSFAGGEITNDELVFGDTAIRALFNDANELGRVVSLSNLSRVLGGSEDLVQASIAKMLVQFAGKLASEKVLYSDNSQAVEGMLKLSSDSKSLAINLSSTIWGGSTPIEKSQMLSNLYSKFGITDLSIMPSASEIENVVLTTTDDGSSYDGSLLENINGANLFFGADGSDNIAGSIAKDSIFTGKGNDTINAGLGDDVIDSGDGNDTLNGVEGNDILLGGAGNDTYIFNGSYGSDTISDSDNSGKIVINGVELSGTAKTESEVVSNSSSSVYKLTVSGKTYDLTLSGSDLVINDSSDVANSITVKNFANGSFGITLDQDTNSDAVNDSMNSGYQMAVNAMKNAVRPKDPLIIDTNNDGLTLSSWQSSAVQFDMDGNGTSESTGWKTHSNIIDVANANLINRIVFGYGILLDVLAFSSVGV